MYATVRIYDDAAGLADAVAAHKSEIIDIFQKIGGFHAYYILKTGPASAVSVTVYDDQSGAEASNQAARDWIAANLSDVSIGAPQVHVGEVAMSS